jgi:hypothetical protein
MRTGLAGSNIMNLRTLELIGGSSVVPLTLVLYLYISIQDASNHVPGTLSARAGAFVILVVPSIAIAAGSYAHAVRQKVWALVAVFVGGILNLFLVALSAGLNYAFIQDKWGQRILLADLLAVVFIWTIAFINTIVMAISKNRT